MNIFICEENEEQRKNIINIIKKILSINHIEGNIKLATNSPDEILDYIKKNKINGVYFIDVELGHNTKGILLAKKINEIDKEALIIMLTSCPDKRDIVFKNHIRAVDCIIKDNIVGMYDRIEESLKFIDEKCRLRTYDSEYMIIKNNESLNKVNYDDIIYFETVKNRVIAVHSHSSYIQFKGKLKDLEEKLDERFIRCHKSFIVNRDKIIRMDKKKKILFMEDDKNCFVSILSINKIIISIKSSGVSV